MVSPTLDVNKKPSRPNEISQIRSKILGLHGCERKDDIYSEYCLLHRHAGKDLSNSNEQLSLNISIEIMLSDPLTDTEIRTEGRKECELSEEALELFLK